MGIFLDGTALAKRLFKQKILVKWIDICAKAFILGYVTCVKKSCMYRRTKKREGLSEKGESTLRKTLNLYEYLLISFFLLHKIVSSFIKTYMHSIIVGIHSMLF